MIPLIDCTAIAEGAFEDVTFEDYSSVAQQLGSAMTGIGMCNLVNHGVSMEKIRKVYDVSKKFFNLPTDTKSKYRKASPKKSFHGYSGPGDEFLNEQSKNSTELREFWDIWGFEAFDEKMLPNEDVPGFKEAIDDPHRVRIITEGRASKDPRQSFVYFINPDGDANVFPLVPILPNKKQQFEKFHNEPVNAYNHYQRLIEAATLY